MVKKTGNALGKALIRDRFDRQRRPADSLIHTTELNDGAKWTKYQSVTEQKDLDEFFMTAQLAGTEFTAERRNVTIVSSNTNEPNVSAEKRKKIQKFMDENRQVLRIPRRPKWNKKTTPEELEQKERSSFLEWRRSLAEFQENNEFVTITPFEKNIEVWKQLWRVIERSTLVVQIVDARNPLAFRCVDLENYVKEVSKAKRNLLLINKADLLTVKQRRLWADYFEKNDIPYVFWSAVLAQKKIDESLEENVETPNNQMPVMEEGELLMAKTKSQKKANNKKNKKLQAEVAEESEEEFEEDENALDLKGEGDEEEEEEEVETQGDAEEEIEENEEEEEEEEEEEKEVKEELEELENQMEEKESKKKSIADKIKIHDREEILQLFKRLCEEAEEDDDNWEDVSDGEEIDDTETDMAHRATIGFVGYPNVGKSSTINVLCQEKKVAVAATPGKTKHFQTLNLQDDITLCDCPGLVFPNYTITKSEMVCNGVLPIDQLRDCIGPITFVVDNIPRELLNMIYGIHIIEPAEDEDPDRSPTAREFLFSFASMRGFMKSGHGAPDEQRAARLILKDYVNGKLLYCYPPPNVNGKEFNKESHSRIIEALMILKGRKQTAEKKEESKGKKGSNAEGKSIVGSKHNLRYVNEVDDSFFKQNHVQGKIKGKNALEDMKKILSGDSGALPGKKSHMSKKKKKLRNLAD